jgi:hypothetical protein
MSCNFLVLIYSFKIKDWSNIVENWKGASNKINRLNWENLNG